MKNKDIFRMDGKKVIVVGSSRGIGKAIALAFGQQGAEVLLASRDLTSNQEVQRQIREMGSGAVAARLDASDRQDIERFFREDVAKFGGVDALVYNSGICYRRTFMETSLQDMDELLATNVKGPVRCMQLAAQYMIDAKKGGGIVVVSSVNSVSTLPSQSFYSSTKSMLDSLVKSAAVELAPHGIRVNSIQPGAIWTDINPDMDDKRAAEIGKTITMGRVGMPEDMGHIATFLCSEAASYITGTSVLADGGLVLRPMSR